MASRRRQTRLSFKVTKNSTSLKRPAEISPICRSLDEEANCVLAAFRGIAPSNLPGREKQLEILNGNVEYCIEYNRSFSIYIYGSHGHGKTASLKLLLNTAYVKDNFTIVYVNCKQLSSAKDIYEEIIFTLLPKWKQNPKSINITKIKTLINGGRRPTLLILDEIDELVTYTNSILYSLFELRIKVADGQIGLIGVGNTQNFIDKLPLVRDNDDIRPQLIEFGAYTKSEIRNIISGRLDAVAPQRLVFSDVALDLLSAKVASSGSARDALGFATAAVHYALKKSAKDDICKVDPAAVLDVINSGKAEDAVNHLVLHDKLVLCSALFLLKRNICTPTQMKLQNVYEQFKKICAEKCVEIIRQLEFYNCCNRIEEEGIIVLKKKEKRGPSMEDKVIMKCNEDELIRILSIQTLFGDILNRY